MATKPVERTTRQRPSDTILRLGSPVGRLVCMYLDCIPGAYAFEIERDLQLDFETVAETLQSLVERDLVGKRGNLYVLSDDLEP